MTSTTMPSSTITLRTCAPRSNASTRPCVNASAASACSSIVTSGSIVSTVFPFVRVCVVAVVGSLGVALVST